MFPEQTINDAHFKGKASIRKLATMTGYKLAVRSHAGNDYLRLKDSIYRFTHADIDGDGKTDLMLGIIKKTHFEPVLEKRLQILRIDSGKLRPLWLGSRLCRKLVDFKPVSAKGITQVLTLEKDENGFYCNGFYTWQDFGLRLIAYKNDKSLYSTAENFFNHENNPY